MKQSAIIVVSLIVLLTVGFTVSYSNATVKESYCCTKPGGQQQEKKATVPLTYFPMVNIF